jgi:hypothetical protein
MNKLLVRFLAFFLILSLFSCKINEKRKNEVPSGFWSAECESIPGIIEGRILLWESWASQIKNNEGISQETKEAIESRYSIAKVEIEKYIQNLAAAFPDPLKVKNIQVDISKIEDYSIFADSLVLGTNYFDRDIISNISREEERKFDGIIQGCIQITNDCQAMTSKVKVKSAIRKITLNNFDKL